MPGVNEGIFPSVLSGNPLFDRGEHDLFMSQNINLINKKWELEREKIRFNLCMASATEELYISYRTCDEQGEYMIKSSFLDDICSLIDEKSLKNVTEQKIYMRNRFEPPGEPQSHKEMLRKAIHYIWKDQSSHMDNTVCNEEILDYINHAAMMEYGRQENPSDSISFLSVLRSPLMSFSDNMIYTLLEGYDSSKSLMSYLEEFSKSSPVAMRAYNLFTKCLKLKGF